MSKINRIWTSSRERQKFIDKLLMFINYSHCSFSHRQAKDPENFIHYYCNWMEGNLHWSQKLENLSGGRRLLKLIIGIDFIISREKFSFSRNEYEQKLVFDFLIIKEFKIKSQKLLKQLALIENPFTTSNRERMKWRWRLSHNQIKATHL